MSGRRVDAVLVAASLVSLTLGALLLADARSWLHLTAGWWGVATAAGCGVLLIASGRDGRSR